MPLGEDLFEAKIEYLQGGGGRFEKRKKQVWSTNSCILSTSFQLNSSFLEFKKDALPTARQTDGRTDGQTDPLIEM